MPELSLIYPDGTTGHQVLGTQPLVVGRDVSCDLTIDDPSASRRHVRLSLTSDGYCLEDLDSKNGTLVNDALSHSCHLSDGDRILIGSTLATYHDGNSDTVPPVVIDDEGTASQATRYTSRERMLNLSEQRLRMIYELSGRLTTLQDRDMLLENAMSICFDMLHFERGAIAIKRPGHRTVDWPIVRNLRGSEGELKISGSLLRRALEQGERAIFTDADPSHIDPTVSMVQQGIRSAMCVPLIHKEEILGVIYGDRIHSSVTYSDEDRDFLAGIAQQISIGLINNRLVAQQEKNARINRDIELARKIQTGLFPQALPNKEQFKAAALNEPGRHVSGDYYDVIETSDGLIWCLVADVTGEGVAASLLTANLQAAIRMTVVDASHPSELLQKWNNLIYHNTDATKFITCILAAVDLNERVVTCASAGHFGPIIIQSTNTSPDELQMEQGFPLGVVGDATFPATTFKFGDSPVRLLFYSDGVIEAMNEQAQPFGFDRLISTLTNGQDQHASSLVTTLRKAVTQFVGSAEQSDDITILAAEIG